ncbi:hypothetical protein JCM5350_002712 [Sporobolomyces pararoseus]
MSTISKSTRDSRTREFIGITGTSTTEATKYLRACNWRLEAALDTFYNDPRSVSSSTTSNSTNAANTTLMTKNLESLWKRYSDTNEIGLEGTLEYCKDISVDPSELEMLGLSYFLSAPTMGKFSKPNWIKNWLTVQCDTLEKQKDFVEKRIVKEQLKERDGEFFKKVYNFSFDYAKQEGQKSMPFEIAQELWNLLIPLDPYSPSSSSSSTTTTTTTTNGGGGSGFDKERLEWWIDFLENEKGGKVVSKDTWCLFLEFTRTIDRDFKSYDEEAAWPSLIDDFVAHVREKRLN